MYRMVQVSLLLTDLVTKSLVLQLHNIRTDTHKHNTHIHTHIHKRAQTHTNQQNHEDMNTLTHTYRTHAYTHAHTRAHTHTSAVFQKAYFVCSSERETEGGSSNVET
jgi:hypothetical protein